MERRKKTISRAEAKHLKLLGEKIRELRKEKKMTQVELARESDLDKQTVFKIEKGEINMTLSTLFRLADALNVIAMDLLDGLES